MSVLTQFYSGGGNTLEGIGNGGYPLDGPFGTGIIRFFVETGTFTVPTGITTVRVRCWGAGGGSGTSGGASSFGSFCTAGGGFITGGVASGGDINRNGNDPTSTRYSGGGAGNLFGNAGDGGYTGSRGEPGLFGPGGGQSAQVGVPANDAPPSPFGISSIDLIGTGGGGGAGSATTGNIVPGGNGFNGGGGGTGGGNGGFPGGGAGGAQTGVPSNGGGGGAFVLKTITGLTPGDTIAVTVGATVASASNAGGNGLVIIEY